MRNIVFLCSGGGGNLAFVHRCVELGVLPGHRIDAVVTDRECGALTRAARSRIPSCQVAYSRQDESALFDALAHRDPDVIITNIHKILGPRVVERFQGRLVNLHYSLLPAFKGTIGEQPVRAALAQGCKFVGTTCHLVEAEVDAGKIICQSVIAVMPDRSPDELMNAQFRAGCLVLLNSLMLLGACREAAREDSAVIVEGIRAAFAPSLQFDTAPFNQAFWCELAA